MRGRLQFTARPAAPANKRYDKLLTCCSFDLQGLKKEMIG